MWTRDLGKPDPAFDYHFRLCADQANEPMVANGIVFVLLITTDSVAAYDLAMGDEKWRFIKDWFASHLPLPMVWRSSAPMMAFARGLTHVARRAQ